jgi:hypothetical protein
MEDGKTDRVLWYAREEGVGLAVAEKDQKDKYASKVGVLGTWRQGQEVGCIHEHLSLYAFAPSFHTVHGRL